MALYGLLESSVLTVLSNLEKNRVDSVVQKLIELGIDSLKDLKYVEENDLKDILPPIHIRKLLTAWKEQGKYLLFLYFLYIKVF